MLSQDSSYKIGHSWLSAGFSFWSQVSNYTKKGPLGTPDDSFYMEDVREDQSDYGVGFEPVVEFEISERLNLRSQTQLWAFEHVRSAGSPHKYNVNKVVETVGVGISVTRDIYLYPHVAFRPDDIRSDRTNMGLNADINLF